MRRSVKGGRGRARKQGKKKAKEKKRSNDWIRIRLNGSFCDFKTHTKKKTSPGGVGQNRCKNWNKVLFFYRANGTGMEKEL